MRVDIYNLEKKLSSAEKLVKKSAIPQKDKDLILEFEDYIMLEQGLSVHRIIKCLYTLVKVRGMLGKTFTDTTREDVVQFLKYLRTTQYSSWTVRDYKLITRKFFKWMNQSSLVDWFKIEKGENELLPEDLLTDKDILDMILASTDKMQRAFIACLAESGARIGEIGSLTKRLVHFDKYGAVLNVSGKTGRRPIRIVWSAAYLKEWLQEIAELSDPVWKNQYNEPMGYAGLRDIFLATARGANVEKRAYHHLCRHTRATEISAALPESRLNSYFGWAPGSKMPANYIHLKSQAANNNILAIYGLQPPPSSQTLLWPRICPLCGEIHGPTYQNCIICQNVLVDVQREYGGDIWPEEIPTHQNKQDHIL